MKKLTSFINEANKQDFTKNLLLKLNNNTILEAKIIIKDLSESYANSQILEILSGKVIENVEILPEILSEKNEIILETTTPINEYYIPWTSVFESAPYYQTDKIAKAICDDDDVISTYNENQFGWNNQTEVVVIKIQSDDEKKTLERLTNKIQNAIGIQWVHISRKDW